MVCERRNEALEQNTRLAISVRLEFRIWLLSEVDAENGG